METSDKLHGYKLMHLKCIQSGYTVTQETVRLLLQMVCSFGVEEDFDDAFIQILVRTTRMKS